MACFVLMFFLILLSVQNNCSFMLVKGDAALMRKVCSSSPRPDYCLECLTSNPKSITENVRGLGGVSINCASRQIPKAQVFLKRYAEGSIAGNKDLKEGAAKCLPLFDKMKQDLQEAYNSWNRGNYIGARDQAHTSIVLFGKCANGIPSDADVPKEFVQAFLSVLGYCEAIYVIMPQIS